MYIRSIVTCRNGLEILKNRPGSMEGTSIYDELVEKMGELNFQEERLSGDSVQPPNQRIWDSGDFMRSSSSELSRSGSTIIMRWTFESSESDDGNRQHYPLPPGKLLLTFEAVWRDIFSDWQWVGPGNGHVKNKICVRFLGNKSAADTWLFQRMPYVARSGIAEVGVGVFVHADRDSEHLSEFFLRGLSSAWQRTLNALRHVEPVGLAFPFVLLGLTTHPVDEIDFIFIAADESDTSNGSPLVERVIEVPPQYQQAMVGILSYFSTYLSALAPDLAADSRVRIEQQNNKLKLVVEGNDGMRHEIERAFDQYQQVVSGERSIDSLPLSPFEAAELRTELRMAQLRVENQKDLLSAAGREIRSLRDLAMELSKRPPPAIHMTVSNSAFASAEVQVQLVPVLEGTKALIDVLQQGGEASVPEVDELRSIEAALEEAGQDRSDAKSPLRRLRAVLDSAQESGSRLNVALEKLSGGIDTAQSLARRYNKIAEWLALPQIPSVLAGKD